ncbi:MAG: M14 family zinc carboxypeptidase [Saprospiraceae bacterium]
MKKITLTLLFILAGMFCLSAQTPEKYARVRIDLSNRDIADLASLGIETDHGLYIPGQFLMTIVSETELKMVREQGYSAEVLIPDMQAWDRQLAEKYAAAPRNQNCTQAASQYATPANYTYGTMAGYYRYQEMLDILDDMKSKYPNLISTRAIVSDTIQTHEGRPLWWVRVSDNADVDENEPEVLYTALHHAREPNSLSQMIFYLWYLLEHYDTDPEIQYILNNEELYFIPCINPDGYIFNETNNPDGYGYWRKNRRDNGDGSFGVDLNRNYGYQWGFNNSGSSPSPASDTYRGPEGFSEPETRMVRDFCLQHDFIFAFNYHTFSNLLIYPWGYSDALAEPALADLAQLFVRENHYTAGVATETVGYYVNGTSDDWMYGATGTFAYTPEVGPGTYGFWPPQDAIDGLNKDNMWQNLAMAFCALRFGEANDLSSSSFPLQNNTLPVQLRRYGFEDGPFTLTLTSLTPNVEVSNPSQVFNLAQFETTTATFELVPTATAAPGQEIKLVLALDNGNFQRRDTLVKAFNGPSLLVFSDEFENLDNFWAASWDITTNDYYTAPSCITDSPQGTYFDNDYNALVLNNPVFIPANAVNPQLSFYARWAIEDDYDYVVVQGGGDNGLFQPLCGQYTTAGSVSQIDGAPIYDGFQLQWVEEHMPLQDFVGQNFTFEFDMVSDFAGQYDGFYLDDLRIEYYDPGSVKTVSLPFDQFDLRPSQPNPAVSSATISWDNPQHVSGAASLVVVNALGVPVWETTVDLGLQNQTTIDVKNWPSGVYTYRLLSAEWQSSALKMVVGKKG